MEIQRIIKERRKELGLTMKDVAKALDVSEATISRYESGDIKNMGIDKIQDLAKVLRCSPGYLMGWEKSPDINQEDEKTTIINQIAFKLTTLSKEQLKVVLATVIAFTQSKEES